MVVKGHLSDILGYSGLENVYIAGPMTGIEVLISQLLIWLPKV